MNRVADLIACRQPKPFAWLMALYAENHQRLQRLLGELPPRHDHQLSVGSDGLCLHIAMLERHRYTTVMGMTYRFGDGPAPDVEPHAFLRIYHDARQVEATHCEPGKRLEALHQGNAPWGELVAHRWRMNKFLNRWLDYLHSCGHGPQTLRTESGLSWIGPDLPVFAEDD